MSTNCAISLEVCAGSVSGEGLFFYPSVVYSTATILRIMDCVSLLDWPGFELVYLFLRCTCCTSFMNDSVCLVVCVNISLFRVVMRLVCVWCIQSFIVPISLDFEHRRCEIFYAYALFLIVWCCTRFKLLNEAIALMPQLHLLVRRSHNQYVLCESVCFYPSSS